jgi:DNA-nicking Smr family endonuclease
MTGRKLSPEEQGLWHQVATTIKPIKGRKLLAMPVTVLAKLGAQPLKAAPPVSPKRPLTQARTMGDSLDGAWERKLAKGLVHTDMTIDLHGETQSTAHRRLEAGLAHAMHRQARVVLLITGRPARDNPRLPPTSRGVIRASVIDWIKASSYAGRVAAIRNASPRHGGLGAFYIILRQVK